MIMDSKKFFSAAQKHLMTATGYMIPFVVAGGVNICYFRHAKW
ncbi:hypothetical protein S101258_00977 [Lactiplantibacillus plantarum subsp. plantarum]|uniref:Uncharacterized protein n=1 Tax=Lactiplantibacillus plantarum subsp. plantarum TaxID=337330 RepID=A0A2S3U7L1_LACPN|nr:hypothetical protein S101258_00977 [Lactiplantibacillus plantarum subsp. plantarum]